MADDEDVEDELDEDELEEPEELEEADLEELDDEDALDEDALDEDALDEDALDEDALEAEGDEEGGAVAAETEEEEEEEEEPEDEDVEASLDEILKERLVVADEHVGNGPTGHGVALLDEGGEALERLVVLPVERARRQREHGPLGVGHVSVVERQQALPEPGRDPLDVAPVAPLVVQLRRQSGREHGQAHRAEEEDRGQHGQAAHDAGAVRAFGLRLSLGCDLGVGLGVGRGHLFWRGLRRDVGHRRRPRDPVCCSTTTAATRASMAASSPEPSGAGSRRSGRLNDAGV